MDYYNEMITLQEAEKNLKEFIDNNPRASVYQTEIDELMRKTPLDKRLEVLTVMICCKFSEIQDNLNDLKGRC